MTQEPADRPLPGTSPSNPTVDKGARTGRICVFCGSSPGRDERYLQAASDAGRRIVERNGAVVYGGGKTGLMGAVADAALGAGGEVFGVLPFGLKVMEVAHESLTHLEIVDTLHERKARMMALAGSFLVLPGGHGTLEEFFEVLTWLQLAIHDDPVGLLDLDGFYRHVVAHLDHASSEGFIRPEHRSMLVVEPTLGGLLAMYSYNALFVVDAATCLLAAVALMKCYRFEQASAPTKPPTAVPQNRAHATTGKFLLFAITTGVISVVFFQLLSTYPLYLRNVYGLKEFQIGLLFAVNTLVIVAVEIPLVRLLRNVAP
ncbi:MAG: TIGR00730 family Rossman fold protein, partial [Planctomycetota bacterium]